MMRDRLADGLVELTLGIGFMLSGWVFADFARHLTADGFLGEAAGLIGRLTLLSLVSPVVVLLLQYGLARRGWAWPRWPTATWRRPLQALGVGVPLAVGIGYYSARLNAASLATLEHDFPILFGLLTALIPLGFAFVSGKWRYYVILAGVAGSGFVISTLSPRVQLRSGGLIIWVITGLLFGLSGGLRWLLFMWNQRDYRASQEDESSL